MSSWGSPAAFVGEFDAQDGPKVNFAFEYFQYAHDLGNGAPPPPTMRLVSGVGFVGRRVAGGVLSPSYVEFMREVAARVLTSNETREESVLFQDPGCPAVGSFTFCLPDILARGEKRRFCLIFLHQDYETLVSHWPTISSAVRIAIQDWSQRTTARYHHEYRTFPDLERRRDEARRKPLRRVTTLLSPCRDRAELADGEVDDGDATPSVQLQAVKDMVCFFEAALPLVFLPATAANGRGSGGVGHHAGVSASDCPWLEARIRADALLADALVTQVDFDSADSVLRLPLFRGSDIVLCPLVVWLCEMVADGATRKTWRALEALLQALLTGNQIAVIPVGAEEDVDDAANLAMALAYTLPPSLASVRLFSDEYVMPYIARIVSLGAGFLSKYNIVPFRLSGGAAPALSAEAREPFVLSEMESDGVVCVLVNNGRITQIIECDRLIDAAAWQRGATSCANGVADLPLAQPRSPTAAGGSFKSRPQCTSTLSQRIVSVLQEHLENEHDPVVVSTDAPDELLPSDVTALRLLDAQVRQLVQEYVLRGRVYTALYQAQEVKNNHQVLSSGIDRSRPAAVKRHAALSVDANRPFLQDRLVFASSTPEDHAVLVFLGSAAP